MCDVTESHNAYESRTSFFLLYYCVHSMLCDCTILQLFSVQVPVISALFLTVFLGNLYTTLLVIPQKLKEKVKLKQKFAAYWDYIKPKKNGKDTGGKRSSSSADQQQRTSDKTE